jgi:hypothetical protein
MTSRMESQIMDARSNDLGLVAVAVVMVEAGMMNREFRREADVGIYYLSQEDDQKVGKVKTRSMSDRR